MNKRKMDRKGVNFKKNGNKTVDKWNEMGIIRLFGVL